MIDRYVERLEKLWRTRKRKSADEIRYLAKALVQAEREYGITLEIEEGIDIYALAGCGDPVVR